MNNLKITVDNRYKMIQSARMTKKPKDDGALIRIHRPVFVALKQHCDATGISKKRFASDAVWAALYGGPKRKN